MLHSIDPSAHGPFGEPMAKAVQACVHCGFCLAACPTYAELGQEMDTPRGRIVLMKQVLEGALPPDAAAEHVDRCLGCLACEPACPSGVPYRDLISPYRAHVQRRLPRSLMARFIRWVAGTTLPYPDRLRAALRGAAVGRRMRPLLPPAVRSMLDLAPAAVPPAVPLAPVYPARGARRGRVALLAGCAQQVLDPDINVATIDVLTRNGIEVIVPSGQGCCGGLSWHTGDLVAARAFAGRNVGAFPSDIDAIITNAAGCGSTLHEYPLILRGNTDATQSADAGRARTEAFSRRAMDVSVYLAQVGLREKPRGTGPQQVAYHDACHLANAQGVRQQPRDLLRSIPGLQLREIANGHLCCGSAGTYNLDQPEIAASLGGKKARAIIEALGQGTGGTVATGNIGCMTQIRVHLRRQGANVRVRHTVQVLRDAYDAA